MSTLTSKIKDDQTARGSLQTSINVIKPSDPLHEFPTVVQDGQAIEPSSVESHSAVDTSPVEDLDEDEEDRFVTTRKGKLRVRYLPELAAADKHIGPYSYFARFKND